MTTAISFWGKQELPQIETKLWRFGPLHVWLKTRYDELWIAHHHSETEIAEQPDDLKWERWTLKKLPPELHFKPMLPNLPVVVKTEHPFRVVQNVQTKIYVRVPLWVGIVLDGNQVIELPTMQLSKTWFGGFVDGEICYSLTTSARKEALFENERAFLAVSPIQILNKSEDELLVDKLCHRVDRLNLYQQNERFWTNETKIYFQGNNNISDIDYSRKVPQESSGAKLVTPARLGSHRSVTAKTFDSIKDFAKLEFLHR
ncbi:MAG: hypothetical protein R3C41_10055 [Calditrichia bacterium]|nr:hypothetical protein [Calditrichota bacterium]MCB0270209.1 hypothetical protein [Calditrichota bacterium]MCB0287434.1 hypothetical protein [Calditrichota bacterium]MCB9069225.1 hypothetical protein [Calditrichia bacterium]